MTALQELMSFIENQTYNFLNKEQLESCTNIQNKANELLEKEKQQIIDAHGLKSKPINQYESELITGEQYYNETFNKLKQ